MESEPLGLIAGEGVLPRLVVEGAHAAGRRVCCVGLRGHHEPDLAARCDAFAAAGLLRPGRWIRLLRRWGVHEAIMVGRVAKSRMHDPLRLLRTIPDWRAVNLWYRRLRHDRRDAAVLAAVADELAANGIELIDSTTYVSDHLAGAGVLGAVAPSTEARGDVAFGWPLLERLLGLRIGQAMAVRERDVIAIEAVEGTDRMIDRAGELCRAKGWTLLKSAAADHDRRADVPSIGTETIERLAAAGARCLAVGAGRVLLLDRPAVLAAADRAGIAVIGVESTDPS